MDVPLVAVLPLGQVEDPSMPVEPEQLLLVLRFPLQTVLAAVHLLPTRILASTFLPMGLLQAVRWTLSVEAALPLVCTNSS